MAQHFILVLDHMKKKKNEKPVCEPFVRIITFYPFTEIVGLRTFHSVTLTEVFLTHFNN